MIHKLLLLLYSAKKPRDFYHFCFWSWKLSKLQLFRSDVSKDQHHHVPLTGGFSLVSVDRFLKIKDHSYTLSFALFNKINQTFRSILVWERKVIKGTAIPHKTTAMFTTTREGFSLVSMDRFLKIRQDSESTQKDLSDKTIPRFLTQLVQEI